MTNLSTTKGNDIYYYEVYGKTSQNGHHHLGRYQNQNQNYHDQI